jgi:hypothetical protein
LLAANDAPPTFCFIRLGKSCGAHVDFYVESLDAQHAAIARICVFAARAYIRASAATYSVVLSPWSGAAISNRVVMVSFPFVRATSGVLRSSK